MFLYKVTAPRKSMLFEPTTFFRTYDFKSSSPRPKPNYIQDSLLYVGDLDEISIHLFPKVHRIRVINSEDSRHKLSSIGFQTDPNKKCYIFFHRTDYEKIMKFKPTVYIFEDKHFSKTLSNEYISRLPVTAVGSESYTMPEILEKWSIQLIPVKSVPELEETVSTVDLLYSYQT